jgi:hypothetical protein
MPLSVEDTVSNSLLYESMANVEGIERTELPNVGSLDYMLPAALPLAEIQQIKLERILRLLLLRRADARAKRARMSFVIPA